jgi:transposase-like protein
MAERQSMTSAGVVAKALIEEHSDFLRESVAMIAAEIMEAEIERQIGAGKGEVSEARATHRNGYRQRPWATRVGEIELAVPRKRSGESSSRASWSPANARRKRCWAWSWRPTSTGSRPARSTTWSPRWASI